MTKKKKIKGTHTAKELIVQICLVAVLVCVVCAMLGYNIGKQLGRNENAPSCASRGLVDYVPPPSCHEITIEYDGVRCCNWKNDTLVCGIPVFKIK